MKRSSFFITISLLLTDCHLIDKKQTEKAKFSNRNISATTPNTLPKPHPIVSRPVSKVVLFKNRQPFCAFSAVKNPQVVPHNFQIAEYDIQLNLPECNQRDRHQLESIAQNSVFLDEKGGVQVAAFPAVIPVALCLAGSALGAYIVSDRTKKNTGWQNAVDTVAGASVTYGTLSAVSKLVDIIKKSGSEKKWIKVSNGYLKGLGIAGVCATGTFAAVMLYEGMRGGYWKRPRF